jgi:hypothetical protein
LKKHESCQVKHSEIFGKKEQKDVFLANSTINTLDWKSIIYKEP